MTLHCTTLKYKNKRKNPIKIKKVSELFIGGQIIDLSCMLSTPKLTHHSVIMNTYCGLGDGTLARMKDINNHLSQININFIAACICNSALTQTVKIKFINFTQVKIKNLQNDYIDTY